MTHPTPGFDSGGFLSSNVEIDANFDTSVALTLDNRPIVATNGSWSTSGTTATTSTARASDPRLILMDAPFSDFDFRVDVGFGDALYLRYVDESNWIRVSQYQTYSQTSYACNPYACNPVACNPYSCNPYACSPYSCNPYACSPYSCNPYSCNCVATYATRNNNTTSIACNNNTYNQPAGYAYSGSACDTCPSPPNCPTGYYNAGGYSCSATGTYCTVYTGQSCQVCYQTCYSTCYQTCYQTCYSTCYQTCYSTCYQTCYTDHYPVNLRLETYVAGTLTTVQDVSLGDSTSASTYRCTYLRVVGKGTNIQVFSNLSPTTPHINQTVTNFVNSRRFGIGRVGYGNQDTGNVLDNLVLKNAI